jgi:hypothetical protein
LRKLGDESRKSYKLFRSYLFLTRHGTGEVTPVETKTSVTRLPDVAQRKVSAVGKLRSGWTGTESGRGSRKPLPDREG